MEKSDGRLTDIAFREVVMDIFEFAMKKEKLAESTYRELAGKTANKGLSNILTMLADEEAKHYKIISAVKECAALEIPETTVLVDAKDVFAKMNRGVESFDFDVSEVELYKKAQQFEANSMKYYLEKASEVEDEHQKAVLSWLAEEENKHYFLLENIIQFVSRPETWLENAEFFHLEDY